MARRPIIPAVLTRGPFTLDDARRAGLSPRQLQGASWRRLGSGLYCSAGSAPSPLAILRIIARRLPCSAAFSLQTAGWLHGLDMAPCDPVAVTIPDPSAASHLTSLSIRRAQLAAGEVVELRGLPVTSALRTVVDIGSQWPLIEAVVGVDMALHHRLLMLTALQEYVATARPRHGLARLRRVVQLADPASESPMETRMRMVIVLAGLPRPVAQAELHDSDGRFIARADLFYPDQGLALEYDGGTHRHSLVEDNRRQNRMLAAGYRLLRFTKPDIQGNPESVVAQVRTALAAR